MSKDRSERIMQDLQQRIISGDLRPGERLDEVSLAKKYDVSRTPIREALLQLSSVGLIELKPRKGAFVSRLSIKTLMEMFELMAELEGLCARLAARRASAKELEELQALHNESREAVEEQDLDSYYGYNERWHEAIYTAARNDFVKEQTIQLRNRLAPYRRAQLGSGRRIEGSFDEHEKILDALKAGDDLGVEVLMREHVIHQGGTFGDFIARLPHEMADLIAMH
ncbi:GntR family transcriptional regulator [Primorskyibacter aestuariivivens]|uniref:GntR family transcriptional regulator n=1 Tax=Primorskyibacter aestuariivivens TaxID=1888912 RepID=UPI00230047DB|nr:GntR family transcriptional regulator [Primorskyibacter aestuariivivens]MDA7430611.1 GntR family transcriptional regulator [Primorskyibacter aestuariivivens]